ncbi:MAG: hypothetical protein V3T84_00795 [Phycisphaerales bacterium]
MLRFLRKYNKYILAVFGTILLVTFLVGSAITSLLSRVGQTGAEWATLGPDGDESLTALDLEQARRELRLLSAIGEPVPLYGNLDRPEHWFLLVREAQSAGLVGGAAVSRVAQSGDWLAQRTQLSGENPRFILETLTKLAGVSSVIDLYIGGSPYSQALPTSRYSDRRFKHLAQDRFHQVTAQVVVLEASAPDEPRAFTEAQLTEQMDKYAEDLPGAGEMGFGYRLPDRAKIEWLVVSADSVRAVIVDSDELNPVALRKHWRLNAARLGQPQPNADVPDAVRNDLLETLTEQKLKAISRVAHNRLLSEQRTHQQDGGPGMSFTDLALSIQETFGVSLPEYHATGGRWLWSKDLAELEGIGQATTAKFGRLPTSLPVLVMSASEFGRDDIMPIQQGAVGPPLDGPDGSIYFFRITDTDPSRPPRSVDEVRDALVADLGRLEVYQDLVESIALIERQARQEGLLAVALANDTVVERASTFSTASAMALPKIVVQEATIQTIVKRARALRPDQPIDELTEQQRTFVVPVEDRLALLVVRLIRQRPLTEISYTQRAQGGLLQYLIMQPEAQERLTEAIEAFAFDALAARYNFKFAVVTATTQPDSDQPDQPSQ